MALICRSLLAVMLWAAAALASDANALKHGLKNAEEFGYYMEIPSYASLTKVGSRKYELRGPVLKIGLNDPDQGHTIINVSLYEGKDVQQMAMQTVLNIQHVSLQDGFVEYDVLCKLEFLKGYWYTVGCMVKTPNNSCMLIFFPPRQCLGLEPYLKEDPDNPTPTESDSSSTLIMLLIGAVIILLVGYLIYRYCYGASKRSSRW
ncbi:hypothetical protein PAPHI01_2589 [Pancytospora philotis]|nr:hypothetical protein PAPHI01_2589 [Pancytospora philotis]